jgi:hypothetical protein
MYSLFRSTVYLSNIFTVWYVFNETNFFREVVVTEVAVNIPEYYAMQNVTTVYITTRQCHSEPVYSSPHPHTLLL